jgi:hypothetical protein
MALLLILSFSSAIGQTGWHQQALPGLESGATDGLNDVKTLDGSTQCVVSPQGHVQSVSTAAARARRGRRR